jgi:hypothetical protein
MGDTPGPAAVKQVTITFVVSDEDEEDYYRAIWYLVGAVQLLGGRAEVVPTLRQLFDRVIARRGTVSGLKGR